MSTHLVDPEQIEMTMCREETNNKDNITSSPEETQCPKCLASFKAALAEGKYTYLQEDDSEPQCEELNGIEEDIENVGTRVKIFHLYFDLFEFTEDEQDRKEIMGFEDSNDQNLFIPERESRSPQRVAETFIHEVFHVIYRHLIREGDDEETIVTKLAIGISAVWVDNPELMRYMGFLLTGQKLYDGEELIQAFSKTDASEDMISGFLEHLNNSEEREEE